MRKTKIDWCDYTWNCASGCINNCPYCYARKIALRFPKTYPNGWTPTFYPERYEKKLPKKPSIIFINSMFDILADIEYKTPNGYISYVKLWTLIYEKLKKYPQHFFLALTKQSNIDLINSFAGKMYDLKNFLLGLSLTQETKIYDWRAVRIFHFISAEPLDITVLRNWMPAIVESKEWVIIGCQTNPIRIDVTREEILKIYDTLRTHDIPLFIKDPLRSKLDLNITEYPKVILKHLGKSVRPTNWEKYRGLMRDVAPDKTADEMTEWMIDTLGDEK